MISVNGKPVNSTHFPDNTSQVWKLPEDLLQANFASVIWAFDNEGEFMQLAQLKMLLDSHGVPSSLRLTYLPYGRQDKPVANNATFALHAFATLLNTLNFESVTIVDPHSVTALAVIDRSLDVYPISDVYGVADQNSIDLFCYPDKGALTKYSEIYARYPHIYGEKVRDQATGNILSYRLVGDCAGKNVLIVDDICDGGMTFKLLAKDLLAAGAKSVVLFVTHGIFSKGVRTLIDAGITRVYTADGEVGPRFNSINI